MYDSPELFFQGRKYLQRAGVLYTIRDRESDDDYDPDEDWTFETWCGAPAADDIQADWAAHQPTHAAGYSLYPNTDSLMPMGSVALYDLDGTLIVSKSGRRWAADADDWVWAHPLVPTCIQARRELGVVVTIVSNQSDWTRGPQARGKIESVLEALDKELGWRPIALIATNPSRKSKAAPTTDPYRKPARSLYDVLLKHLGASYEDMSTLPAFVTMCGDAAGPTDSCLAYRWADSDRVFADNIGAIFERPCDIFSASTAPPPQPLKKGQELVVLVGNPGSGKTTTARRFAAAGYVHVEQDAVGSKGAVLKAVKTALAAGKSVVVDATHGSADNRAPYMSLSLPVRFLWHIRDGRPYNAVRAKPVPEIAYAVYSKHFSVPTGAPVEVVVA
jgi:bifunctional polynucleotide phosphatase/kinase